jgi:hypothetical protein
MTPPLVAVVGQSDTHAALLAALEAALPVRFERVGADAARSAPAVVWLDGDAEEAAEGQRSFVVESGAGAAGGGAGAAASDTVVFGDSERLDVRLRGATMRDPAAAALRPLDAEPGEEILARGESGRLWTRQGPRDRVALGPAPLPDGGALLELLRPEAWLSLLPLVHFLREVAGPARWSPPPLRAAFLIDDPNLHSSRYGHIAYRRLVEHADEHGYHTAFAMVPLDAWFAHPAAARLFRERADRLSLLVHGNDHLKRELGQERSGSDTVALLAQAQRRMDAFERRSGVAVDRVMAAPHGACSRDAMAALPRLGYEAACISRPYPWLDGPPPGRTLAGWEPGALVATGTPVVPRIPIERASEQLPLRAFLDQPLVVYGHHDDLAGGLDPFASLAGTINGFGPVRWERLAGICRSNFATRVEAGVLSVRAWSRRLEVEVPAGVDAVGVELPGPDEPPEWRHVTVGGERRELREHGSVWRADPVPVAPGRVEIYVPDPAPVDPAAAPGRRTGAWPLARRALVEARDRLGPVLSRG